MRNHSAFFLVQDDEHRKLLEENYIFISELGIDIHIGIWERLERRSSGIRGGFRLLLLPRFCYKRDYLYRAGKLIDYVSSKLYRVNVGEDYKYVF